MSMKRESDLGMSMKCVQLMPDDIVVLVIAFSFDRDRAEFQGGMCLLGVGFKVCAFSLGKGRARPIYRFQ